MIGSSEACWSANRLRALIVLLAASALCASAAGEAQAPSSAASTPKPGVTADPAKQLLVNTGGAPMSISFRCTAEEMQAAGLSCSSAVPCPVFLEISAVGSPGARIYAVGNFHTQGETVSSVVLASEDGGKTWFEAHPRLPVASLEQIEFFDFQNGWISGALVEPSPRDPFILLTRDGGKTWRMRPITGESPRSGIIDKFHFSSSSQGIVYIDRLRGADDGLRYETWGTNNGGDSWSVREVSGKPIAPQKPEPARTEPLWRVREDAKLHAFVIETRRTGNWLPVASFLVNAGECRGAEYTLGEPPPEPPAQAEEDSGVFVIQTPEDRSRGRRPPARKPAPSPKKD
jgi:photosystem II stability/assembly factor-like uncharacterized protein